MALEQRKFRWRNDDGSESAATYAAAENANIAAAIGVAKRIRFLLQGSGTVGTKNFRVEYRKQGETLWKKLQPIPLSLAPAAALQSISSDNLTLTVGGGSEVTTGGIAWDAVAGADSYRLYWGTSVGSLSSSQDVGSVTSFGWIDLSPRMQQGTTYYVQVRSVDGGVESDAWGTTVWLDGLQVG